LGGVAGSDGIGGRLRRKVAHLERLELPKIAVVGVERADAVLKKDRCNVDVVDKVPANRHVAGDVLIGVDEAVPLGQRAHVRQPEQRGDVSKRFGRRQRRGEDARMRGDAQIGHQRRPCQTEDFRAGGARLDKAAGADVPVARAIRRVEEHVDVERIAHDRSASRTA
jgi:hypothetical protein